MSISTLVKNQQIASMRIKILGGATAPPCPNAGPPMCRSAFKSKPGLPNPIFRNQEISSKKPEVHQEFFFLNQEKKQELFLKTRKHLMAVLRMKFGFSFTKALVTSFHQSSDGKIF
jgi:hypothetical protein